MSNDKITIRVDVSAPAGAGKTSIIALIHKALECVGIEVDNNSLDCRDRILPEKTVRRRVEHISKNVVVQLNEVSLQRNDPEVVKAITMRGAPILKNQKNKLLPELSKPVPTDGTCPAELLKKRDPSDHKYSFWIPGPSEDVKIRFLPQAPSFKHQYLCEQEIHDHRDIKSCFACLKQISGPSKTFPTDGVNNKIKIPTYGIDDKIATRFRQEISCKLNNDKSLSMSTYGSKVDKSITAVDCQLEKSVLAQLMDRTASMHDEVLHAETFLERIRARVPQSPTVSPGINGTGRQVGSVTSTIPSGSTTSLYKVTSGTWSVVGSNDINGASVDEAPEEAYRRAMSIL